MSLPISGFTAVPNPMMLSFLASQGFAIMYFGGAGWQFGKRKVSGMSNEEVNAMTPEQFMLKLNLELKGMVPTMQQGMKDMTPLIHTTMVQFGAYIREAIRAFPEAVGEIFAEGDSTFRGNLAAFGSASLIGTGGRAGQSGDKLIDQIMAAIVAAKKGSALSTITKQEVADAPKDKYGNSLINYKGNLYTFERLQQLLKAKTEAEKRRTVRTQVAGVLPQIAITNLKGKKKAGQSQIMEKERLTSILKLANADLIRFKKRFPKASTVNKVQAINKYVQKLSNLLARYDFTSIKGLAYGDIRQGFTGQSKFFGKLKR